MIGEFLSSVDPKNKNQVIGGISAVLSMFFGLAVWGIYVATTPVRADKAAPAINRIAEMLGGNMPLGLIQVVTFFFFLYGLLTLLHQKAMLQREQEAFKMGLLPAVGEKIIKPEQVQEFKLKMLELENSGFRFQLIGMIKRVCNQYRNEGSISDTLEVLNTQTESAREESQTHYGIVEYLSPGVSSLGFLGTVLGISEAIGKFDQAGTQEGLSRITKSLYVAFDTTFFALLLGIVLSYYYNRVQDDEQRLFASMKAYIVDNLVSRIYHGGVK